MRQSFKDLLACSQDCRARVEPWKVKNRCCIYKTRKTSGFTGAKNSALMRFFYLGSPGRADRHPSRSVKVKSFLEHDLSNALAGSESEGIVVGIHFRNRGDIRLDGRLRIPL